MSFSWSFHLARRSDGMYLVDLTRPDGRRQRLSLATTDETKARRALTRWKETVLPRLKRQFDEEAPSDVQTSKDRRLRDIVTHYVDVHLPNKNAAPKSIVKAIQVLGDFERFAAGRHTGRVSQLTPALVDAWASSLRRDGLAPKTIKTNLGMLRACLNAAIDRDLIDKSPIRKWILPTVPEPEIQPLTPAELVRVLETIRDRRPDLLPIITWIALTGNRPSDAVALAWPQVDLHAGIVIRTQVKTKQLARYEISPAARALLQHEKARPTYNPRGPVFLDRHGAAFTVHRLYHDFTRTLSQANLGRPVTLKDLRHTFASLMANTVRCPIPTLQRLLGHRNIATTMRYVHPADGHESLHALDRLLAHPPKKRS